MAATLQQRAQGGVHGQVRAVRHGGYPKRKKVPGSPSGRLHSIGLMRAFLYRLISLEYPAHKRNRRQGRPCRRSSLEMTHEYTR